MKLARFIQIEKVLVSCKSKLLKLRNLSVLEEEQIDIALESIRKVIKDVVTPVGID